ncbi:MAG: acyltransferase family protein [Treponema sp.]|nr:acyltransferase family protein [Candidatus Treponema caballi]
MENTSISITKERNYGIDLLRMVSMFMVCVLHVLEQGGILDAAKAMSAQYEVAWFLDIAAFCAVNCFALISGYVGVDAKFRYTNGIMLWLRVFFYTLIITVFFAIFVPDSVHAGEWIKCAFPVMTYQYWYFTCYAALFIMLPLLNKGLNALSEKELKVLAVSLIILFSVLQIIFKGVLLDAYWQDEAGEVFTTAEGYSPIWIIVLYVIGACLKKTGFFTKVSVWKALIGFILCALVTWAFKYVVDVKLYALPRKKQTWELQAFSRRLANYISPTILFEGIFLVALFEKLRLPEWLKKMVKVLSPMAFSVYLIHVHQLVWNYVLPGRFESYAKMPAPLMALAVLGTALGIYALCTVIDFVRVGIEKALKLKQRISAFENSKRDVKS